MVALDLALALVLLVICSFAPGFFFIRHLRWSPMEKFCGSIGLSFLLLYLSFGAVYCLSPSGTEMPPEFFALISISCVALGLAARREVVRLFRSFRLRQALIGFSFLLVWTLLILAMIRNYSGANWMGDWQEHFQRSLFFLHHFPTNTPIFIGYQLPARPPMMNVLAAFFLAQTRDRFEVFQVVFAFLNLVMFLPCCLIVSALAGPRKTSIVALVALFAMNPMVMQNVTYTWTKAFAAFYVVLALWFYLAGWRKNDGSRMTAAFVALSAGILVHYSAGIYCLFFTLHYLLCVFWKRPHRWRELVIMAAACGSLLATWFTWSIAVYGSYATFASNTSVSSSQRYQGNNLRKIAANGVDSIVPVVLRNRSLLHNFDQQTLAGTIRDNAFIFYQTNLIFSMGLIGGPLILRYLYRAFCRRFQAGAARAFWLAMIAFCVVVGIASVGERDPLGVAHVTLLPLEVLGLSLLAAMFPMRRALLILVVVGCLSDFSLGIFLHAHIESLENTRQKTIFTGLRFEGDQGSIGVGGMGPNSLSRWGWTNWFRKHQYALATEWLLELSRYRPDDADFQERSSGLRTELQERLHEDEDYWHGWYARNDGSIKFLGDDVAGESDGWGTSLSACLLIALMLALMRTMLKQVSILPASDPNDPL
jgi:hypothetical protein